MALDVGSHIAHYQVTALIGEGGMGRVYRARDTKLDRDLAPGYMTPSAALLLLTTSSSVAPSLPAQ